MNTLISLQKIYDEIAKMPFIFGSQTFQLEFYLGGGEALVILMADKSSGKKYWLKLYFHDDDTRASRYSVILQANVLPYKCAYIPDVTIYLQDRDHQIVKHVKNALIMEDLPYPSWTEVLENGGLQNAVPFANSLIQQVIRLEQLGIAHRDISANNLLIDEQNNTVFLIDWDQFFKNDNTPKPLLLRVGTPGYYPNFKNQYEQFSDRFSLAIVLMEMFSIKYQFEAIPFFKPHEIENIKCRISAEQFLSQKNIFQEPNQRALKDLAIQSLTADAFCYMPDPNNWSTAIKNPSGLPCMPILSTPQKLPVLNIGKRKEVKGLCLNSFKRLKRPRKKKKLPVIRL